MLWTAQRTLEEFAADELLYDAVLMNLEVLGEAAKRVPVDLRLRYPAVDWRGVAGFRDVAAHFYFGLSVNIVWSIVTIDVPQLAAVLPAILAAEQAIDR